MSSLANINVEALRFFIGTLQDFNSELESNWGSLNSRWQAASDTWQDVKKDQFTGTVGWDDVIKMMEKYLSTSEEYANFLKRLEERATAYLDV